MSQNAALLYLQRVLLNFKDPFQNKIAWLNYFHLHKHLLQPVPIIFKRTIICRLEFNQGNYDPFDTSLSVFLHVHPK